VHRGIVHRHGIEGDRRWAIVDATGAVLTARRHDVMLRIAATPTETGLVLSAPDAAPLEVPFPVDRPAVEVGVSRMPRARYAGDAAAQWCSRILNHPVRLVWQADPRSRAVSAEHGGRDGDHVTLADAAPLLIASAVSLRRLNHWIGETDPSAVIPISRFRPNVVIDDGDGRLEPFAEDDWGRVRIGGVTYRFGEHCDRCVLTTIDPDTLVHGKEPIRTLARHRQVDHKTRFAVHLVPLDAGRVGVGDPVTAS
jgi:uncharacterized protein YcbX